VASSGEPKHELPGTSGRAVAVGGHDGDYRDWDEIRAWAEAIATSLHLIDNPEREPAISTGTRPLGRK
jgi:hypothetical protein